MRKKEAAPFSVKEVRRFLEAAAVECFFPVGVK
ncbi:hypothetical protein TAMC210_20390 [Thermanaeromonas sp. C210]|nr:hypothetical protein TAMC210_20390 [Thermanaeromonas sp. C210]